MKNPWIRLYRESVHNPKVVMLNDRQHRAWHNCMLIADDNGYLPKWRDLACHMRMTIQEAEQVVCELVEAGLVDIEGLSAERKFRLHDWEAHQYISDVSTDRVRKFRNKNNANTDETFQKRPETVSVTPPEQKQSRTETDTDLSTLKIPNKFIGKVKRGVTPRLQKAVEGLGLPVAELLDRAMQPDVREPNAMFRHLAVDHLQAKFPRSDRRMLAAALTKGGEGALAKIYCMMLEMA